MQVHHLNQPLLQSLTVLSLVWHMSGTAFGMGLILFYFLFHLISNFRDSKNRGSMDPVHIFMDLVHGPGPWKGSMFCTFPYKPY